MSDWKESVLSEFAKITMGQSPKGEYCNGEGEGLPLLNGPTEFGPDHPYPTQFTTDPKRIAKKGDILFCVRGSTTGRMNWANQEYAIGRGIASISSKSGKHNSYVYHLLNYRLPYLLGIATGSTFPNVSKNHLYELPINIPDNQNLEVIECILKYIDQKTTLLREQNQTLEELAQTLFKWWFVEFNFPDKDGKPYKDNGGKMIDSELGEIPEEWRIGEIADHVNHSTKSISPSKEPEKLYNHYSIPAFDNGRYPTLDNGESILSNKYEVIENTLLVSKLNPSTSRVWSVFNPKQNAICSTEIQVFIPEKNKYSFSFGLFHYSGVKREMAQRASGTSSSHQRVRPGDILNIKCVIPLSNVLEKFENSVLSMLKKIEGNQEEIQTLTQLRDTLLPKLMSGELRIKN